MELYYIVYNEIQDSFHYESHRDNESRPKNGYYIVEKCFSLEEASKRANILAENKNLGYNRSFYGY